jgi:hypothetical protein
VGVLLQSETAALWEGDGWEATVLEVAGTGI